MPTYITEAARAARGGRRAHRLDAAGEPGRIVGDDEDAAQRRLAALGDLRLVAGRHLGDEAADRRLLLHADHRVVIAAHAEIADIAGAAGQDLMIGGRDMGVGADHRRDAAVAIMAERHLLAGRLGMEIDDDRRARARARGRRRSRRGRETGVERVHEQPAHQIDDQQAAPVGERDAGSSPRPACRAGNSPAAAAAARGRYRG